MRYNIPEKYAPGFQRFSRMSEKEALALRRLLERTPAGASIEELSGAPGLGRKESLAIKTIYSLVRYIVQNEDSTEDIIEGLAVRYKSQYETKLTDRRVENLKNNLLLILKENQNLFITGKAFGLYAEHDKVLLDSRIINDIRLVFEDSSSKSTDSAILCHKLKLEYYEDGESRDIFISLDSGDLTKLRKNIDRALKKDKHVRNKYKDQITFITPPTY